MTTLEENRIVIFPMELDTLLPHPEESWITRKHLFSYIQNKKLSTTSQDRNNWFFQEMGLSLANSTEVISLNEENENMIRRLTQIFVPIAFAIILIIGLVGNILVIVVVSDYFYSCFVCTQLAITVTVVPWLGWNF